MAEDLQRADPHEASPRREARSFAVRLSLYYAALFLLYGIHLPYFPVWLDWRGLSAFEIALVTGAPFFLRLVVTPLCAVAADRADNHRGMVIALSWVGLGTILLLSQVRGFEAIFVVAVAFALATSTIMPLTETIAVSGVRTRGLDYGRMRLWGSVSFIAVGFVGGALLDLYGGGSVLWVLVVGAVATVVAAHFLPRRPAPAPDLPRRPAPAPDTVAAEREARGRVVMRDARRLLRSPLFLAFLVAAGTVQAAHAMFYTFGALHLRSLGHSTTVVGALWGIGILAEVTLFAFSGAIAQRVGATALLIAGGLAAVVRWTTMAFDPSLAVTALLQVLHALTYSATHLGAIHFVARAVPGSAAGTAQAMYATAAAGVLMGASTLLSGALYPALGAETYLAMAGFAVVGSIAAVYLARRWSGEPLC